MSLYTEAILLFPVIKITGNSKMEGSGPHLKSLGVHLVMINNANTLIWTDLEELFNSYFNIYS